MVWRALKLYLLAVVASCSALKSAAQSNSPTTVVCSNAPQPPSLKAPAAAGGSKSARGWLFGPPPFGWLNLPFKTDDPPAAKSLQSGATGNALHSSIEERHQAVMERLAQESVLKRQRSEKRFDDAMSRVQFIQSDVSFDHEQINILKTMLR